MLSLVNLKTKHEWIDNNFIDLLKLLKKKFSKKKKENMFLKTKARITCWIGVEYSNVDAMSS